MPSLVRTETISISSGDTEILAYLAEPSSPGRFGAIVVIQEVFGVNSHIREVTERLAREGYVAIAPHIYHRQAPGFEVGYTKEELELGRSYKQGTKAEELLADVQGAIAYLYSKANVIPEGVGCIGFCFGGHVAYLAATLPQVKATASFYGAGIATMTPGGSEPTLSRTAEIEGTLYGFFGEKDSLIAADEVDQIEAALKDHGVPYQIFRYPGAEHGFFCDQRYSYHPEAASDAWEQVLQLFKTVLPAAPQN
ncbi:MULTISPECIES: dienelactone hydrolase family protein [Cyanophyceae]|uniref:dienelactone hydrolase family protein n=1 Tax=Cyanophyceae TaxID=3028117 RepID=UPI0016882FB5|nr:MULTISPECIES: dienelactone hydrolase family protein [Cyanophyceae]MBD1916616.1 dienelactone hydrolase family protein [Phormidium sp. FACHB-77]MBD2032183.1 dienelactone hydrolase family protein [Phormidium sp. FACHB-322]MBD2053063.1 dienelactone hydrolase family protein [Leptolyngbya sp. FACHB-60]